MGIAPDWLTQASHDWFHGPARHGARAKQPRVLTVEDSDFFRQLLIPHQHQRVVPEQVRNRVLVIEKVVVASHFYILFLFSITNDNISYSTQLNSSKYSST